MQKSIGNIANIKFVKKNIELSQEFVREVIKQCSDMVELIMLFGSAIREDFKDESDIDILIVVNNNYLKTRRELISIATDITLKYGRIISPKIFDLESYNYLQELNTPFMKNINREGKMLWKRD